MSNIRKNRAAVSEDILKGRFIASRLENYGKEVNQDINQKMANFTSPFWSKRNFTVSGNTLVYTHPIQNRFVDMKTRRTKSGIKKKKRHRVHNSQLYGHANMLVRELAFGYVSSVKEELAQLKEAKL